ncbi:SDR family NAD(P)-dependent oxidoreductase [Thalassobacter stenotrophicus]|uniref:SDR family NAD(P)-dependent oxidoreductase n=1 Tax=Thalassobacter stenotrophicus TaxID=266809 RepID=UPI0022A9149A|nr:SDR family NAD(P)-dependent oxidoreductase [Thalassobacter stenotrophicus]UYP69120.1 SDR family NAD(P)-dependent oxidoreductase [Thalassobacter stenotrophicus]
MQIGANTPAIVTGGASGLGRAVATRLLAAGAPVTLLDRAPSGEDVAAELGADFIAVDVTQPQDVADALAQARAAQGQERICVNCAGIAPAARTVGREGAHDAALFLQVINVNLVGSFNVASQSAAGMAALSSEDPCVGVIINTASIAAYEGQIGQAAYAASKGGIVGMTLPMARDLAKARIRVAAIAPGIFGTPMVKGLPEDVQEALAADIPNPSRLGAPEEFASLVAHIIDNDFLNGEVIRLDGATRLTPR